MVIIEIDHVIFYELLKLLTVIQINSYKLGNRKYISNSQDILYITTPNESEIILGPCLVRHGQPLNQVPLRAESRT